MNEQQKEPGRASESGAILPRLSSGQAAQDEGVVGRGVGVGDGPIITHQVRAARTMTTRGAVSIGATLAGIVAAVFWASYAVTGGIFCSGLPRESCPSSWVPYAVVATIGFVIMTSIGGLIAWVFFRLYSALRVD